MSENTSPLAKSTKVYLKQIDHPILTRSEEEELFREYNNQEGDKKLELRNKIVKLNLRLVVNMAKRFRRDVISFGDLIQAGNIGLIRAVEMFDVDKGNKFSTYAVWWIRQKIHRLQITQYNTIRISFNGYRILTKILEAQEKLMIKNGHPPTTEELSAELELPRKKVEETLRDSQKLASLESPVEDGEGTKEEYWAVNDCKQVPDRAALLSAFKDKIVELLNELNPRQAKVLKLEYGIGTNPKSQTDIAGIFGVSRQRISQIHYDALDKIKGVVQSNPEMEVELNNLRNVQNRETVQHY